MLKAAWNKVVYGYEYIKQVRDLNAVKHCDSEMENARGGYRAQIFSHHHGGAVVQVKITPQEADEIIQEMALRKVQIQRVMEKRREAYGLTF